MEIHVKEGQTNLKSLRINLKLLRKKLQNCKFKFLNLNNVL